MRSSGSTQATERTVVVEVVPGPVPGTWSVTFRSQAVPGTLAVFAGTLSSARLDIISAVVRVRDDGVADTFDVSPLDGAVFGPADGDRLAQLASDVLNGKRDLAADLAELRSGFPPSTSVEPRVEIRTDSALTTGVNVVCADRPGLLHDITAALSRHGLRTRSLSVLTFTGIAHDTFRVVDSAGEAPSDAAGLAAIREELLRICE